MPLDTQELARELLAGGVTLPSNAYLTVLEHRGKPVMLEIPLEAAANFPLSDIVVQASYLLARLRTHSPTRLRFEVKGLETRIVVLE